MAGAEPPPRPGDGLTGALSGEEEAALRAGLLGLLERRAALWQMGESSSIRVEAAEELLASLRFLLRLWLRDRGLTPRDLLAGDWEAAYQAAVRNAMDRVERERARYAAVLAGVPPGGEPLPGDTLRWIGGFFRRYDPRFFAHQVPCDIDYQLCRPVPEDAQGVAYLGAYLSSLEIEHEFLGRWPGGELDAVLRARCREYGDLLVNLFEPVFTTALGAALTGGDLRRPRVPEAALAALAARLEALPPREAVRLLEDTAQALGRALGLAAPGWTAYLRGAAADFFPRLDAARAAGNLGEVFPCAG